MSNQRRVYTPLEQRRMCFSIRAIFSSYDCNHISNRREVRYMYRGWKTYYTSNTWLFSNQQLLTTIQSWRICYLENNNNHLISRWHAQWGWFRSSVINIHEKASNFKIEKVYYLSFYWKDLICNTFWKVLLHTTYIVLHFTQFISQQK